MVSLAVLCWDLATEQLSSEDGHEKGYQEDKQHQVADTGNVSEYELDQLACHRNRQDEPVDSEDLKDGEPRIDHARVSDWRDQNHGGGEC